MSDMADYVDRSIMRTRKLLDVLSGFLDQSSGIRNGRGGNRQAWTPAMACPGAAGGKDVNCRDVCLGHPALNPRSKVRQMTSDRGLITKYSDP